MALAIPNTSPAVQKIQEIARDSLSKYDDETIANDKQAMSNVFARDYHEFCDWDTFFDVSSEGVNKIIKTLCDNNNLNGSNSYCYAKTHDCIKSMCKKLTSLLIIKIVSFVDYL